MRRPVGYGGIFLVGSLLLGLLIASCSDQGDPPSTSSSVLDATTSKPTSGSSTTGISSAGQEAGPVETRSMVTTTASTSGVVTLTEPTSTTPPSTVSSTTTTLPVVQGGIEEVVPVEMELTVIRALPHDPQAFTQGLVLRDGLFYESTGLYGRSSVRIVDPATGAVLLFQPLDGRFFGEGLELVGDRLIQLTWMEGTALVWDAETLEHIDTFTYEGEGWGLCARQIPASQDQVLVMSDGSSWLTFRDPDTFGIVGEVEVLMDGVPISNLNELECVGDLVFANIWMTDLIVIIDPTIGQVIGRVDASSLPGLLTSTEGIDVLNGIAYDQGTGSFYLTGKLWPNLFEVVITPPA